MAKFGRTLPARKSKDRLQQVWHDLTALFVDDRSIRDGRSLHRLQQCQDIVLHEAGIKLVVSELIAATSSRKMKGFARKRLQNHSTAQAHSDYLLATLATLNLLLSAKCTFVSKFLCVVSTTLCEGRYTFDLFSDNFACVPFAGGKPDFRSVFRSEKL